MFEYAAGVSGMYVIYNGDRTCERVTVKCHPSFTSEHGVQC
jgi:hypothetical protein